MTTTQLNARLKRRANETEAIATAREAGDVEVEGDSVDPDDIIDQVIPSSVRVHGRDEQRRGLDAGTGDITTDEAFDHVQGDAGAAVPEVCPEA